jgi:hypothetical protein
MMTKQQAIDSLLFYLKSYEDCEDTIVASTVWENIKDAIPLYKAAV